MAVLNAGKGGKVIIKLDLLMLRGTFVALFLLLLTAANADLSTLLTNNQAWANSKTSSNSSYFTQHATGQSPKYLWIGCSDSRVPPNLLLGLDVGQVFVLRNIANVASPSDISTQAVIQYTVQVLGVTDIIVAGHYGCGGVKAALTLNDYGMLEFYLSRIRHLSQTHQTELNGITDETLRVNRLVELNVHQQVLNVAATPFVQTAWASNQELRVHGVVYDLQTGNLNYLDNTKSSMTDIPDSLAVVSVSSTTSTSSDEDNTNVGLIVGLAVGIPLVLLLLAAAIVISRQSKSEEENQEESAQKANTETNLRKQQIIAQ